MRLLRFLFCLITPLQAADPILVLATKSPPVCDGKLDDPVWAEARVLTDFTQVLPRAGATPSERTEVRFCQDGRALYIAVHCFTRDPQQILAKEMIHDGDFSSDDAFLISLDTFGLERDGYYFRVNPVGARTEGVFGKFSFPNSSWDTIWNAQARILNNGWCAEIEIPFKSLSFDPSHADWRINLERTIRHSQETVRWRGINPGRSVYSMEQMGNLQGMLGAKQGMGLEFKPYLRGGFRDGSIESGDQEFKFGADVTWRITPSLTFLGTYQTDFAETDVDERRVNLTRFPLFFSEKRDFFLQDAPLFVFGGLTYETTPFFSRRIGLSTTGRPVEILGGARLTGRIGDTNVALLNVWQDAQEGIEEKMLSVARVSQRVLDESSVGMIFTQGDPSSNLAANTVGVDFNYHNGHLPGGKLIANIFALRTDTERAGGEDWGFGADVRYPNEPFEFSAFARQWGDDFLPALGFLPRNGIREMGADVEYLWRVNNDWLRSVSLELESYLNTDLSGNPVLQDHDLPFVTLTSPSLDKLSIGYTWSQDVVDEAFEMVPGILIPAQDYGYGQFRMKFSSSEAREVSWQASARLGDYYEGSIQGWTTGLDWRPNKFCSGEVDYELKRIELPQGAFDVHVASARVTLAFTPDITLSTVAQYDSLSDNVGVNARLRWTVQPGTDLFLVFNQGWSILDQRLERTVQEGIAKLGMTVRF
jgi:hypothetical protein